MYVYSCVYMFVEICCKPIVCVIRCCAGPHICNGFQPSGISWVKMFNKFKKKKKNHTKVPLVCLQKELVHHTKVHHVCLEKELAHHTKGSPCL